MGNTSATRFGRFGSPRSRPDQRLGPDYKVRRTAAFCCCLLVSFAGCGGGDATPSGAVPEQSPAYTEQQVIDALELTKDPNPGGTVWDAPTKCTVAVVLTTPAEIETYASSGDSVASNPSRTAGVKYVTYEGGDPSGCHEAFTDRLAALD